MTQPKLTPAQQRVMGWLGESRHRSLTQSFVSDAEWYLHDASDNTKPWFQQRSDVLRKVAEHLCFVTEAQHRRIYVHPKFAKEASDDQ